MHRLYNLILQLGIDDSTSDDRAVKIKMLNGISALIGLIMILTGLLLFWLFLKNPDEQETERLKGFLNGDIREFIRSSTYILSILTDFLSGMLAIGILFLNRSKRYRTAVILFLTLAATVTLLFYVRRGILTAVYIPIPLILPFVFYDKKYQQFPVILIILSIFIYLTFLKYDHGRGSLFSFSNPGNETLIQYLLNFTVALLIILVITYYFKNENVKNSIRLNQKNSELEALTVEISAQRDEIFTKKLEIESKNTSITDSINYAKHIQVALLPRHELLDKILPEHFILLRPKDIVSGDFYWFTHIENLSVFAAVDCTGHGVPGAFMSMLGSAFLNEIVNKEYITHPGVILRRLRKEVIRSLHQKGDADGAKDGMDLTVCVIDYQKMKIQFAGANNPLYLVRSKDRISPGEYSSLESDECILYEIKGDHMPASIHYDMSSFTVHEFDFHKGDMIYMFSDGYADQFGGPSEKKFGYKNFRNLLLSGSAESVDIQMERIEKHFDHWKGDIEQIDDIMVVGIRL